MRIPEAKWPLGFRRIGGRFAVGRAPARGPNRNAAAMSKTKNRLSNAERAQRRLRDVVVT